MLDFLSEVSQIDNKLEENELEICIIILTKTYHICKTDIQEDFKGSWNNGN